MRTERTWTMLEAAAVALLAVLVGVAWALSAAGPAHAHHAVNAANGDCDEHDALCWPKCEWEWGGVPEVLPEPCDMPPEAPVAVTGLVDVNSLPPVEVTGSVEVDQGAGWEADPDAPASQVEVVNEVPIPTANETQRSDFAPLAAVVALAAGVLVGAELIGSRA